MTDIPFYRNPDNSHCWQCCLRMIQEYFYPDKKFSFEEWDELTGKKEGLWSFPLKGMAVMEKLGFEVINWKDFDYNLFADMGGEYLKQRYGEEIGNEEIKHCDIASEMENAKNLQHLLSEPKVPDINDLKKLLKDGYLVICNVNSRVLKEKSGYSGHFVTIYEMDSNNIFMHDPGPPGIKARIVPLDLFERAWCSFSPRDKNIMAFKPNLV